jgi:signal transduction histidine kinase
VLRKRLTSPQAVDIVYAVVFVLVLFQAAVRGVSGTAGLFVLLGFGVALAIRRRSPRWSLALAWALALAQMAGSVLVLASNVAIFGILYCSAAYGSKLLRQVGLGSAVVGGIIAAWYLTYVSEDPFASGNESVRSAQQFFVILAAMWAVLGLSWALGRLSYARRSAIKAAHAQELAELQQARAQNDIAIEQERNRIARDMHDIVAHSLAVVIAQADGARYVRAVDPDAVDSALTTISATAREALGDVRVLLAQLRHSEDDLPTPAVTDIGRLIERMRAAGLRIDATLADPPAAVGAAAGLALYRIAQESLTNALRHGDTSQAVTVTLVSDSAGVELVVANALALSSQTASHHGHGVVGMRERAALSGGVCTAGGADGRWTVRAWIPTTKGT